MASVVDICNLALSHLGDNPIVQSIDPPDSTVQAKHCATFYPLALNATLEMYSWGFAKKRVQLNAETADGFSIWAYKYLLPEDYVRAVSLYPEADFEIEGRELLTNQASAVLLYINHQVSPDDFTPLFVEVLSVKLAALLAGPIIKGLTGQKVAQALHQKADIALAHGSARDANANKKTRTEHVAPWHVSRLQNGG